MTRFRLRLPLALFVACLLAAPALAGPTPGDNTPGRGPNLDQLERALEGLDLDPTARDSALEVLDAARAESRQGRRKRIAAVRALNDLLSQAAPDEDAVMAQVEVLGAAQIERSKLHLRTLLDLREVIGDEAWQALRDETRAQRRSRLSRRR